MTQETMMTAAATQEGATTTAATDATTTTAAVTEAGAAGTATADTGVAATEAAQTPEQIAAAEQAKTDEAAAAAKAAGAPEKYEAFKAPEGATLDAGVMGQFEEAARELNLPQDAAQKMVDKMAPIMAARQAEQLQAMRTGWAEESKADKEFGGEQLSANMAHAQKAMTQFATPELKSLLNESGLGNHPELIRFMVRAGKALGEDKIVNGGESNAGSSSRTAAEVLYPSTKSS